MSSKDILLNSSNSIDIDNSLIDANNISIDSKDINNKDTSIQAINTLSINANNNLSLNNTTTIQMVKHL